MGEAASSELAYQGRVETAGLRKRRQTRSDWGGAGELGRERWRGQIGKCGVWGECRAVVCVCVLELEV